MFCRSRARDGFVSVSELSAVRTRWFGSVKKCLAGERSDMWGRSGDQRWSVLCIVDQKWTVSTSGYIWTLDSKTEKRITDFDLDFGRVVV